MKLETLPASRSVAMPLRHVDSAQLTLEADPCHVPPADLIRAVEDAGLIVFRGTEVMPDQLEALARSLGVVDPVRPPEERLPGTEHVRLQSNLPGMGVDGGGMYWHADGCWRVQPTALTLLRCAVAPRCGGETRFVDGRVVYQHLDDALRPRIENAFGIYPCKERLRSDHAARGIFDAELTAVIENTTHPLLRPHPTRPTRALILNQYWLSRIDGLSPEASDGLLAELYDLVERTPFHYDHQWSAGDLLVWDNRSLMHRATAAAEPKITWRVVVERLGQISSQTTHARTRSG